MAGAYLTASTGQHPTAMEGFSVGLNRHELLRLLVSADGRDVDLTQL